MSRKIGEVGLFQARRAFRLEVPFRGSPGPCFLSTLRASGSLQFGEVPKVHRCQQSLTIPRVIISHEHFLVDNSFVMF